MTTATRLFIAATIVGVLAGGANASGGPERRLYDDPLGLRASTSESDGTLRLRYAMELCYWECPIVIFTCESGLKIRMNVALPREYVGRWFALGSRPIESIPTAVLTGDGVELATLSLLEMGYGEMDGVWWNHLSVSDRASGWLSTIASAGSIAIESPAFEIVLSPAVGDPEARAAFVEACLAM